MKKILNGDFELSKFSKTIIYIIIALLTIAYIVGGNIFYSSKVDVKKTSDKDYYKSEILEVGTETLDESIGWITTPVKIKITSGDEKGLVTDAELIQDELFNNTTKKVAVGDKYIAYKHNLDGDEFWGLGESIKSNKLLLLLIVFFAGLLILGGKNGINTIISLTATCLGVFMVFIPSILAGYNIYLNSIIVCIFIILITLPLVAGLNKKCIAAICGCFGGVMASGLVTMIMSIYMNLSGMINEESVYLTYVSNKGVIDLKAIIFAAIIIGSLGATMDVAISIASSMHEIAVESTGLTRRKLTLSGLRIGRDVMGTMTNTLILAYIGSSLSVVILLIAYNSSLFEVLNKEAIVAEILQSLAGSIGMLLTIPITAVISAHLYKSTKEEKMGI